MPFIAATTKIDLPFKADQQEVKKQAQKNVLGQFSANGQANLRL